MHWRTIRRIPGRPKDGVARQAGKQDGGMGTYAFEALRVEGPDEDGLLVVAVDRPEAKNALDARTVAAIGDLLSIAEADAAVRGLVVTGSGKLFGVGADLPELSRATDEATTRQFIEAGHKVFERLSAYGKPTAAAINGLFCLGGSLELALACHFRVASTRCRLGLPEIKLGVIPGYGGTQRLPRLIGPVRALEWMLTGEQVRGDQAYEVGLVHRAVDPGNEVAVAKELLRKVLVNSPEAVRAALTAWHAAFSLPLAEGLRVEQQQFLAARSTEAAQRGIDAQAKG